MLVSKTETSLQEQIYQHKIHALKNIYIMEQNFLNRPQQTHRQLPC